MFLSKVKQSNHCWDYTKNSKCLKSPLDNLFNDSGQMCLADKYSQHNSIIWPVRLNGWVFIYKLTGCEFEFH